MKALTIRQPWASLISLGVKTIETRSWSTKYRGPLAIHAGKEWAQLTVGPNVRPWVLADRGMSYPVLTHYEHDSGRSGCRSRFVDRVAPLGAVVATCTLVDVVQTENADTDGQRPFGDFTPGRYAWLLDNIVPITPVPAKGKQGLWTWEPT